MDEAIIHHIQRKYSLLIGERTAELIKITIGSAYPRNEIQTMEVKGRDLVAGVPKTIEITEEEIREALMESLRQVVESVRIGANRAQAHSAGACLGHHGQGNSAGRRWRAASQPRRFAPRRNGLPVTLGDDPLTAVVMSAV
jgi:rod shape-determining protein MreB